MKDTIPLRNGKKIVINDASEQDNPIRQLNIKYNLPISIGKCFIGKTERDTEECAKSFVEYIEEFQRNKEVQHAKSLYTNLHTYTLASLYTILDNNKQRLGDISLGEIISLVVMLSNLVGMYMEKDCAAYGYRGIKATEIRECIALNPEIIESGLGYHIGDTCAGKRALPYGYDRDIENKIYINELERRNIYKMYSRLWDGVNYNDIADELNAHDIPNKSNVNAEWTRQMVYDVLNRGVEIK